MSSCDALSVSKLGQPLLAVCFDLKGTLVHHRRYGELIPGMDSLLTVLKGKGLALAVISTLPPESVVAELGGMAALFEGHVFSGEGVGKLRCVEAFAKEQGIADLSKVAFVDDRPANLLPVATGSKTRVMGFAGTGMFPEARQFCSDRGIPFAESVRDLEALLGVTRGG